MKRNLQQWLPFLVGGVVLAWYLSRVDWPAMGRAMAKVNYWWIVPIVAFNLLSLVFRAYRWRLFLAGLKRIDLFTIYNFTAIGFMLNCILPGRLGEVLKPYLLKRKENVSFSAALGTCFTERVYDLTAVIIILALSLLAVDIPAELTVALSSQTSQARVVVEDASATVRGGAVALARGRVVLGEGETAIAGEIVAATGALAHAGLLVDEALVRFATGTVRFAGGPLQLAQPAAGEGGTLRVGRATGTLEATPVIEVRHFVRRGGIASALICAVFIAMILMLAYATEWCVRVAEFCFSLGATVLQRITGRDLSVLRDKAVSAARKFAESLDIFHRPGPFVASVVHTFLIWFCIMMTEYLLFVAFDLGRVGLGGAYLLSAILALSVAAPQLPGYLGVFQVACLVTLAILGIEAAGVPDAYANLLWMVQVLPIIAAGFVALRIEGMSLAQVRKMEMPAEEKA